MTTRRLHPKLGKYPALTIARGAFLASELVYIGTANKQLKYPFDASYIAYIGTTKNGASRVAGSAVWKGSNLLSRHGVHTLEFYVVACPALEEHETWRKLERALLIRFRERFGAVPYGNSQGKGMRPRDEADFFTPRTINKIIDYYSYPGT